MRSLPTVAVAVAAVIGLCSAAPAQPVTFVRIADTATAIPGGSGNFGDFVTATSISGSTVAFYGASGGVLVGAYAGVVGSGQLTRIADFNTQIPNGVGTFTLFGADGAPVASGSGVLFRALGNSSQVGFYSQSTAGGPLNVVVDSHVAIPNGTGTFHNMSGSSISGSTVIFSGGDTASGQRGLYSGPVGGGPLVRLVDIQTPIPFGSGNFTFAGGLSSLGSTVAFTGTGASGQQGIYTVPVGGGAVARLADTNSAIPNGTGNFAGFGASAASGSTVAFLGSGSGNTQQGLYSVPLGGGSLSRIADLNTPIPNGTGSFTTFTAPTSAVSASGSTLAFEGFGSGGQVGIYGGSTEGGALAELIAAGDPLDGRIVSSLSFGGHGLDGSEFTFAARFTDGTSGVYVGFIPVPEPSVLGLIGTALVGGWLVRRRRTVIRKSGASRETKFDSARTI